MQTTHMERTVTQIMVYIMLHKNWGRKPVVDICNCGANCNSSKDESQRKWASVLVVSRIIWSFKG